jgi:hypothetical protein
VLLVFALVKTFWPRRSVALPTMPLGAPVASDPAIVPRVAALVDQVSALESRIALIEESISDEALKRS